MALTADAVSLRELTTSLWRIPSVPDNSYEQGIVDANSTPGLKKNQLDYAAKKEHLNGQGMTKYPVDRDKILAELYPDAV
jgi:hypothetical protein